MNLTLPDSFLQRCEMVRQQEEIDKINKRIHLCETLKILGSCKSEKCNKRHLLSKDLDFEHEVHGYIKFEILSVHDVSTFAVRILEFNTDGKINKKCINVADIEQSLRDALDTDKENVDEVSPGKWLVAFEGDKDNYKRCEVLKLLSNGTVRVFYFDYGLKGTIRKSNLYELPDEFKKVPPQGMYN